MSQQDLWSVAGRARYDGSFATQLFQNMSATLQGNGYSLTPDEIQLLRAGVPANAAPTPVQPPVAADPVAALLQDERGKVIQAQSQRTIALGNFTIDTLQDTIRHATSTYKVITVMNQIMFGIGVALFIFAVIYGVYSQNLRLTLIFAGLGTATFVSVFLLGPIDKAQLALSNLIAAEIAFLSFFEQMWLLENYASLPCNENTRMPDPNRVERASELMQMRSGQMTDLVHKYLEKTRAADRKQGSGSSEKKLPEKPEKDSKATRPAAAG